MGNWSSDPGLDDRSGRLAMGAGDPKYKVNVSVVNIPATVRDQSGKMVNDLSKDDFILMENGKRQDMKQLRSAGFKRSFAANTALATRPRSRRAGSSAAFN
jgi:hypothetical protein